MPVNLSVMAEVGREETPIFTWNPVEQMWVQERGGAAKPPPAPHDVHAIQTWFLDRDEKEWIQTVLGPMGRQLAAQWKGAYRVPETGVVRKSQSAKKSNPMLFLAAGAVLVALIGGVAMAAPGLMGSTTAPSAPNTAGATGANPGAPTSPAQPAPTAEPTPEPTTAPATPPPATPRPRPAGPSVTLRDGTVVYYTGPFTATRGGTLLATFTVIRANGAPGSGSFGVFLNDPQTVANRRAANGTLDGSGRVALSIPTNVPVGAYELLFSYGGDTQQIATVTVR